MKHSLKFSLLIVFCLAQVGTIGWSYVKRVYPLWTGTSVYLKVLPRDPRSLFRGNYARLNYEISNVQLDPKLKDKRIKYGDVIYVPLKEKDGIWTSDRALSRPPSEGVFIKGRVVSHNSNTSSRVQYDIEAFFAPKEKALALERDVRKGDLFAKVMIAPDGQAVLVDVEKVH